MLIPPLSDPLGEAESRVWRRMLCRGGDAGEVDASAINALWRLFGRDNSQDQDIPVAAVSWVGEGRDPGDHWWIRADPVHLAPIRDRLVLIEHNLGDLTFAESESLAATIRAAVAEEGWRLETPVPNRWYLQVKTAPRLRTYPPELVQGRDIDPWLPTGEDARRWHAKLTELQMLLHTAETNADRERRGVNPVNSLWLWGGGKAPSITPCSWTKVWANDPFARGLAKLSGAPVGALPANARHWVEHGPEAGAHLVVATGGDSEAAYTPERLEKTWLTDLAGMLTAGELERMTILPLGGRGTVLNRRDLRGGIGKLIYIIKQRLKNLIS